MQGRFYQKALIRRVEREAELGWEVMLVSTAPVEQSDIQATVLIIRPKTVTVSAVVEWLSHLLLVLKIATHSDSPKMTKLDIRLL